MLYYILYTCIKLYSLQTYDAHALDAAKKTQTKGLMVHKMTDSGHSKKLNLHILRTDPV